MQNFAHQESHVKVFHLVEGPHYKLRDTLLNMPSELNKMNMYNFSEN